MSEREPVLIFWSDNDGGFIALAYQLPGLSAFGATREEALKNITEVISLRLELDAESQRD